MSIDEKTWLDFLLNKYNLIYIGSLVAIFFPSKNKIAAGCSVFCGLSIIGFAVWRQIHLGYDFPIYYNAAAGISDWGWVYPHYVRYLWWPLTFVDLHTAAYLNYIVLLAAIAAVAYRTKWPAIPLVGMGAFNTLLTGNVVGLLALLVLNKWTCFIAVAIKPYLAPFLLIHAWRNR